AVSVIVATFVYDAFPVGQENWCVGLNVPVFGDVTVPCATAPPPSKLSVTWTVLFTSVSVAWLGSTFTATLVNVLFVPAAVGLATVDAVFVRSVPSGRS